MALLTAEFAQTIVARTMAILPYNINVMDENGVIIGSGDAARLGALHDRALLAIGQQRLLEIDAQDVGRLKGVQSGVNLPLRPDGKIVGVIGITGEPEAVRSFAELVCMIAEMILGQRDLLRIVERDARIGEEVVLQLIRCESGLDEAQRKLAQSLGFDLDAPRVALVVRVVDDVLADERGYEHLVIHKS